MAINLDVIGKRMDPVAFRYDEDTVILYALGIGAGVHELDFVYEKNLKVFPTFAVIPLMSVLLPFISAAGINFYTLLHGEQEIVLHNPIPTSGTVHTTAICESILASRRAMMRESFFSRTKRSWWIAAQGISEGTPDPRDKSSTHRLE